MFIYTVEGLELSVLILINKVFILVNLYKSVKHEKRVVRKQNKYLSKMKWKIKQENKSSLTVQNSLTLAIYPFQSSLLTDLLSCILCPYRAEYVFASQPILACSYAGVHKRMSLMKWFVRWKASGHTITVLWDATSRICSRQHVTLLYSSHLTFSEYFVRVQVIHLYSSIDTATAWKKSCFILSDRLDFHMTDGLLIAFHALPFIHWYDFQ